MTIIKRMLACLAIAVAAAGPARAEEMFGGLYIHDIKTPLTYSGIEGGVDLQLGLRLDPVGPWKLQPYLFGAVNSEGNTHYAAAGVSRRFDLGGRIYFRPGLGIAVHTGSARKFDVPDNGRIEFGSRILFQPEVALGAQLDDRFSVEASWVHLSHAQIFGGQNPGIDNMGLRLNYRFK